MAGYVLHFPAQNNNDQLLERFGLESLAAEGGPDWWDGHGAENQYGMMCGWGLGIDPDAPAMKAERTWKPLPGCEAIGRKEGDVWLGVEVARPLASQNIARKQITPGYNLILADSNAWHCPALCNVSHVHRLNGLGQYERTVSPEHIDLWDTSQEYAGQFFEAVGMLEIAKRNGIAKPEDAVFTCRDAFAFCCQCLALNYRVTPEIVSLLGLIHDDAMRNIIKAAIDLPVLLDFTEKKKTPLPSPLADGGGVEQGTAALALADVG